MFMISNIFTQMGNPSDGDDIGCLCFNAERIGNSDGPTIGSKYLILAKQWPGMEDSLALLTMITILMGISSFLKIETGTSTDIFIGFNRAMYADVPNAEAEADDEVAIYTRESNGDG